MFGNGGLSAGDAIALMGNGRNDGANGWGDGLWVLIILFAIFGWGGNGWGNNGGGATQGALTRGDLCMDMNFNDVQNGVRNVSDQVGLGFANLNSTICNQQYDTARMINASDTATAAGFNAMNISNLQSFNALQAQLAQCCCDNRAAIAETNYNMAQNTCAITNAINQGFTALNTNIDNQFCQLKMEQKDQQLAEQARIINQLQNDASNAVQTNQIINTLRPFPTASYQVPNPFTGQFGFNGYGYGNCGCNC